MLTLFFSIRLNTEPTTLLLPVSFIYLHIESNHIQIPTGTSIVTSDLLQYMFLRLI